MNNDIPRGFLWTEADGEVDLGAFVPNAINDSGQMAGSCVEELSQSFQFKPCFWEDGSITDLSDGARFGAAFNINDRGEVVGQVESSAFVWSRGTGTVRLPTELPGQSFGSAAAINDSGLIAGFRSPVGGLGSWRSGRAMEIWRLGRSTVRRRNRSMTAGGSSGGT